MLFKRVQHDGLFGVIFENGKEIVNFKDHKFETDDPALCEKLIDMGYDHEGEISTKPSIKVCWIVRKISSKEELEIFDKKKDAEKWLLEQKNATELEIERQENG